MKKTLIAKHHIDVTHNNDGQIEAIKSFMRAGVDPACICAYSARVQSE